MNFNADVSDIKSNSDQNREEYKIKQTKGIKITDVSSFILLINVCLLILKVTKGTIKQNSKQKIKKIF